MMHFAERDGDLIKIKIIEAMIHTVIIVDYFKRKNRIDIVVSLIPTMLLGLLYSVRGIFAPSIVSVLLP